MKADQVAADESDAKPQSVSPHRSLAISVGTIVTMSWLTICFVTMNPPSGWDELAIGYLIGTMFAHATLAAAWCAFGPGGAVLRIPLSVTWAGAVVFAFALNGQPRQAIRLFGAVVMGQYLALQIPLWLMTAYFGIRLRHRSAVDADASAQLQFGILHLLMITAIAAAIMGAGRVALASVGNDGDLPIFVFLVAAAIVQSVPLLIAALLRDYAWWAAGGIVVLIAIATTWELSLLKALQLGDGPNIRHLIAINFFCGFLTLVAAATARLNGFCLTMQPLSVHPIGAAKT